MYGKNKGLKPRRYEIYLFIEKKTFLIKGNIRRKNLKIRKIKSL